MPLLHLKKEFEKELEEPEMDQDTKVQEEDVEVVVVVVDLVLIVHDFLLHSLIRTIKDFVHKIRTIRTGTIIKEILKRSSAFLQETMEEDMETIKEVAIKEIAIKEIVLL
mmetsp:Transcript_1728/g.3796  ORF Transcript_1728/g.3796 Transcript_1728/m.3796 type:complete len:110 (+) Transcript_1728:3007-3336(+)